MNPTPRDELADKFRSRISLLDGAAALLEQRVTEALSTTHHVDRISFRVKDPVSFAKKCLADDGSPATGEDGVPKYREPLEEVEDQIAGRVLVFFRSDLPVVEARIREWFHASVETQRKRPSSADAFGYESDHYIFVIDEHMKPAGWDSAGPMPTTFELQIRTLFMHAYAEPQHDLGYKGSDLPTDVRRRLAWIAASAWGADTQLDDLYLNHQPSEL